MKKRWLDRKKCEIVHRRWAIVIIISSSNALYNQAPTTTSTTTAPAMSSSSSALHHHQRPWHCCCDQHQQLLTWQESIVDAQPPTHQSAMIASTTFHIFPISLHTISTHSPLRWLLQMRLPDCRWSVVRPMADGCVRRVCPVSVIFLPHTHTHTHLYVDAHISLATIQTSIQIRIYVYMQVVDRCELDFEATVNCTTPTGNRWINVCNALAIAATKANKK